MIHRWLFLLCMTSSSILTYVMWRVSPFTDYPRINIPVIIIFFITVFVSASTIFALVGLRLHKRWPMLAGARGKTPEPTIAVRQGLLFGLALIVIALLALVQMIDIIFVLVIFLLMGLLEGFFQSQQ